MNKFCLFDCFNLGFNDKKKVEDDEIRNMFILNAVDWPVFKDSKFFA